MTSVIVHFGVGNFHRSHQAKYLHELHTAGLNRDWHIVGAGVLAADVGMRDDLRAQDFAYTLVERSADGEAAVHRIETIRDMLIGPDDADELLTRLADPHTKIVSLTITEGGYNLSDGTRRFDATNPQMAGDPWAIGTPTTVFGFLAASLERRRDRGIPPFTVMSCDNIENNGAVARTALTAFTALSDASLADWIAQEVPFPSSMVDRITPATTEADRRWVLDHTDFADRRPVFSEDYIQWVLEDRFLLGRPDWDRVGVQIVDDVAPFEAMKLRMLNGSHQSLAYAGLLAGYVYVHEAIADPVIGQFVDTYLRDAQRTVPPVPDTDLDRYRRHLIQRFSNVAIRDTLARLATDASDRIPKFVVPVAADLAKLDPSRTAPVAVIATWAHAAEQAERNGAPLPDRQYEQVRLALQDDRIAAGALLDGAAWFGSLGSSVAAREVYARIRRDLQSVGIFDTLRRLQDID